MVTKKPALRIRSRRGRSTSSAALDCDFESLRRHVEAQRSRLTDAEAVLDCLAHAMEEDERLDATGTRYPSVVRIARNLVSVAIDQLDSIYVRSALGLQVGTRVADSKSHLPRECEGVKERQVHYLH